MFGTSFCAQAFSISPLKFSATVAPGDNKEWEVKIKNDSDHSGIFIPVILGLKQDNLGRPVFENNIDIAENWLKVPLNNIKLTTGETKSVIFSASIPLNAAPGAHYLGLGIREQSSQSISTQLVTILNLQIAGLARESLSLEKFLITKKIFFDKNWLAELQIRNAGNIGLDLIGQQELFYFGQKFEKKSFSLGNNLFVQTNRNTKLSLFPDKKIILPGFYRIDVQIFYGFTHQTINQSLNFWYLPAWFLVVIGIVVLLGIFFIFRKNKNVFV